MWSWRSRLRRTAVAGCLAAAACLLVLLPATPAQAHAVLVGSDPAAGAVVAGSPPTVTLRFSERLSTRLSTASLVDGAGRPVAGARAAVDTAGGGRTMVVRLPVLSPGTYAVAYRVLGQTDGHQTAGVLVFSVGRVTATTVRVAAAPPADGGAGDTARRAVALAALSVLIGGLLLLAVALPTRPAVRQRIALAVTVAGASAVVLGAADLAIRLDRTAGTPSTLVLGTPWGRAWLAAQLLAIAAIPVARWLCTGRTAARRLSAAIVVTGLAAAEALRGHAAAAAGAGDGGAGTASGVVTVAVAAVHAASACGAAGLLGMLALAAWPRSGPGAPPRFAGPPVGRILAVTALAAAASGLYGAGREVTFAGDVTATGYGRTLLVKVALVAAVTLVAALAAVAVRGAAARSPAARVAVAGAVPALVLGVLVASGALMETVPANVPAAAPLPAAGAQAPAQLADLSVTLAISPNQPGVNGVTVLVASSRRPPPDAIESVTLRVGTGTGASAIPLQPVADGRYFGSGLLTAPGPEPVTVVVSRGGAAVEVPVAWSVGAPAAAPAPRTGGRLAPLTDPLAGLLGVGVLALTLWWSVLSRWRWRVAPAPDTVDVLGEAVP